MNTARLLPLAVLSVAGAAAAQPPTVSYNISFRGVPVGGPTILMYMDYAQIVVNATVSPPVGTVVSIPPPGTGFGTVAGLATASFDILGCDMISGTWTLSGPGFQGTTGTTWGLRTPWQFGSVGTPQPNGDVINIVAAQFPFPANSTNPVNELWRGRWDYASFWAGRRVRLTLFPRDASLLVQTGISGGSPQYTTIPAAGGGPVATEIFLDSGPPAPCTPAVMTQPQSTAAYTGHPATFHASGIWWNPSPTCGPLTYRWRRDCQTLVNGGNIAGTDSDTLVINPVTPADAGQYDVVVSGTHSSAAALTILCFANCDNSTTPPVLNANDFGCFLNRYASGDTAANCDASTALPVLTINDFSCFLNRYAAGCP